MPLPLTRILALLDTKTKRSVGYIIALTLLTTLCGALIPFVFKALVDRFGLAQSNVAIIPSIVMLYGALWTSNKLLMPLQFMLILKVLEKSIRTITQHLFAHLHNLSVRFHLERKTATIISTIGRAQTALEIILYGLCISIIPTLLDFACTCFVFGYWYSTSYSILFFATTICSLGFSALMLNRLGRQQKAYHTQQDTVRQKLLDSLLNYETVKYFNNEQYEYSQFNTLLHKQEQAGAQKHTTEWLLHFGQNLLFGICLAYITWKSAHQVLDGTIQLGDFVLINSYFLRFIIPLEYLGRAAQQVKKSLVSLKEITQLLDNVPEITDAPNAVTLAHKPVTIQFKKVYFGYQPGSPILSNLSFSVVQGKTVALVGATGAGKSTITRLLLRLYDVESGAIMVNNHDIRTLTQSSLRSTIGIVAQEISLFNDTLFYNVTYGCPEASQNEVERVMAMVQLDSLVHKLPYGYQTIIGERGLRLSGGEKQRLSIARALLKNAMIYIFDESTSNLDTTTESIIQRNLAPLFADKTVIIIAHRLSNVAHVDEILVLERGTIAEHGTHDALITSQGRYYQLWSNNQRGRIQTR